MKQNNTFFETFVGEYVEIVQDFEVTTSFNMVEDQTQEIRMPMTVAGFFVDDDGEFVYLSQDGTEINQALPRHTIKHIGIVEAKDEIQEALDGIPEPDIFN